LSPVSSPVPFLMEIFACALWRETRLCVAR